MRRQLLGLATATALALTTAVTAPGATAAPATASAPTSVDRPTPADRGPVRGDLARQAPSPAADDLSNLPVHPEWGSIQGTSGTLFRGCKTYSYSYAVTPPEGTWAIEVFITGPNVESVAAGAFLDGFDPLAGSGTYKLCDVTTKPGTFTIQAKVSVDDGFGNITEGQLPPSTYVLTKDKKKKRDSIVVPFGR